MSLRIIIIILFITTLLTLLFSSAIKNIHAVKRDIPTLLNFYYIHKDTEPLEAKDALDLILLQDPNNSTAIQAKTDWFVQKGDTHSALNFLVENHKHYPLNGTVTYELAKIYILLNQYEKAKPLLKSLTLSVDSKERKKAEVFYQTIFPEEQLNPIQQLHSFIEPIQLANQSDLSPLYQRVNEIINLQPDSARSYLQQILSINPGAVEAYLQLGYLELKKKNNEQALHYLLKAFSLKPSPMVAVQIAYIYAEKKDEKQAVRFFNYALVQGNEHIKQQSRQALNYLVKSRDELSGQKEKPRLLSPEEILWNTFYNNKKTNPQLALKSINALLRLKPQDIKTLKEAAYFATSQKDTTRAIALWKRAYALENNPESALSIGYLYSEQNSKYFAFRYFNYASKTSNKDIKLKAEIAKTNLAGSQFKILPEPYFIEFYAFPFYFSRFDLGVLPIIVRAGKTIEKLKADLYFTLRRTKDNRSGTLQGLIIQNSISQIFEDNVAIYAAGIRKFPWPKIPLLAFLEIGKAEDLVYRFRPRWRNDVRGGLVYFNAWGVKPTYAPNFEFPLKWITTLYSDVIYYSRYNDNIIGTAWFRPGLRMARYHSSSLDLYMANYLVLDKNKEFYNNFYAMGPGVAIQPNNRINLVLRLEALQGYYIPVNSPTPNPYGSKYWNKVAMLEVYFRF